MNYKTFPVKKNLIVLLSIHLDVESHHQRIRSDRTGTTYSPERIDNESPGKSIYLIHFAIARRTFSNKCNQSNDFVRILSSFKQR